MFFADVDHKSLSLPRQPFYPVTVDFGFLMGRFPEFWISWSPKSYGFFFSAGLQQQVFGLDLAHTTAPLKTSFSAQPLIVPGLFIAYRFPMGEPYIPKPYVGGAVLPRFDYEDGPMDKFSPVEIMLTLGYDWESPALFRLYVEIGASMYFLGESYKDSPSKGSRDPGFLQAFVKDALYFEAPIIRIGLRIPMPPNN
jgi:hypothetical protein